MAIKKTVANKMPATNVAKATRIPLKVDYLNKAKTAGQTKVPLKMDLKLKTPKPKKKVYELYDYEDPRYKPSNGIGVGY